MPLFEHVTPRLPVADLGRSLEFYTEHLGFSPDVLWPAADPQFAIVRRDGARVGLIESGRDGPGPIGYAELYVEVDDARALHGQLSERLSIEWGPEVYSYGRLEFAVRDPDNYLVIFTEPTEAESTTEEPR